jgi:multiple sugar transport system substrate-binding protein
MKKILKTLGSCLIILMFVSAFLAGCSTSSTGKGKDEAGVTKEVVFWEPDSATWQPLYDKLIKTFEEKHTKIKIKKVAIPGDGYDQKLNAAFAAGDGPDLWVNWYANNEYDRGYIASLDDLIKNDNWDMNKYFQPITNQRVTGSDGKIYGLPRDINMVTMLYNKDLFDKYNVPYPKEGFTFREFRDMAKKLTNLEGGIYGTDMVTDDYTLITGGPIIWNWMNGKDLASEDGWVAKGYMDDPKLVSLYEEAQGIVKDGSTLPAEVGQTMTGQYGTFASGKVAMSAGYLWGYNVLKDLPFKWGVTTFPAADDGTVSYARNEPVLFYMNAKTKTKEQTWEFMKYMAGEEVGKVVAEDFTWGPPVTQTWIDLGLDKDANLGVFFREGNKKTLNPVYLRHNKWWEAQDAYAQAFTKMMKPLKGEDYAVPSKVLPQVTEEVQKKLDELKNK